jgi:transcriptional regulator with XRE-family HTH domain
MPEDNFIGSLIREAREKKGFTQEELAAFADVSSRSVGDWERGRCAPSQEHKQALIECLELASELLGVVQQRDFSPEEALAYCKRIASYLNLAMFNSALISCNFLVSNVRRQVEHGDRTLLEPLIDALHLAGHTVSIARNAPEHALRYYQQMEHYIFWLKESDRNRSTLLSLARTYQGEMSRRQGDIEGAFCAFRNAPQGPEVHTLVKGNRAQLSARVYTKLGDFEEARRQLDRSLELLGEVQKDEHGLYVCYNLCGTYIEYARFYLRKTNIKESLKYIELAEQDDSQAPRWRIPVLINKGKLLLYKASRSSFAIDFSRSEDFQEGMRLLEEAIDLAYKAGHRRQLLQIAEIKNNLFHQGKEYLDASYRLNKKLDDLDKLTHIIVN